MCRPYSPNEIWGITILSNRQVGDDSIEEPHKRYCHELVQADHPVFKRGELCPVTKLYGIPLLVYSQAIAAGRELSDEDEGNQLAVFLRIEPNDGFAPTACVRR